MPALPSVFTLFGNVSEVKCLFGCTGWAAMLNLAGVRRGAGWWMGELWYSVSRGEALEGVSQGSLVQMSCRDLSGQPCGQHEPALQF